MGKDALLFFGRFSGFFFLGALLPGILFLTACAERHIWYQEGISKERQRLEMNECLGEARAFAFTDDGRQSYRIETPQGEYTVEIDAAGERRESELFQACMQARGYRRILKENGDDS